MASTSLRESSSVTQSADDKLPFDKSNLHRTAKSHFTVRVGGARQYADTDYVKPHGSHAHLNLSHVVVADQPQPESSHSGIRSNSSMSETALPHKATVSSSNSSASEEETAQSRSNPTLSFLKDDQGDRALKLPSSKTGEIIGSASSSSLDATSTRFNTAEVRSSSWSSISSVDEIPPDNSPAVAAQPELAEVQAPPRNILALFKVGLLAARRNALVEEEKPAMKSIVETLMKMRDSTSGEGADKDQKAVLPEGSGSMEEASDTQKSTKEELKDGKSLVKLPDDVEVREIAEAKAPKKESSVEMQVPMIDEVVDNIKEAKVVAGSMAALDDKSVKSGSKESKSSGSVELPAGESTKSSGTTISEFETLDLQTDRQMESAMAQAGNIAMDSLASSVDTVVQWDSGIPQDDTEAGKEDKTPDQRGQEIVPSNDKLKSHGQSRSESSVEVIFDVKRDSSSLDGLAIAEERELSRNSQMQEVIDSNKKASEKLVQLQAELKSSKEETLKLRQQLDVQVMCEEFVRNEAEEEIQKAVRKVSRLQAQIDKPPKLINKYRKELRRIFQEIESEGGPNKVWASIEGLQLAIRFLYWNRKDVEKVLHETEENLQASQTECSAWKSRAKEQEAAKEQLITDLEELQSSKTKQIGINTHSQSDTCLSYGSTEQRTVPSDIPNVACWGLQEHSPSKLFLVDKMETWKSENKRLREQLLDLQNQAQQQRYESIEAKSHADLLQSKLDGLNDELILERLHSQHLSTKLHCHEVNTKNSMLFGLAEKLDVATPPIEEAITTTPVTTTTLGDIDGLEDWLGHLKAEQQHTITELARHKEALQTIQDHMQELMEHKCCQENSTEQSSEVKPVDDAESNVSDNVPQKCDQVTEDKLWQELRQLRDVQLETLADLEDKDNKITELQHRYNEVVAEQLQQRVKLEMDLEDNKSEKQEVQERLEETQQLVSELHRKCIQLGQALEEAHITLAKQEKTIQDLKEQFAVTLATKQEELDAKDQDNARAREELEKRLLQLEAETREVKASESKLQRQLAAYAEENRLLQKQCRTSTRLEEKFDIIQTELEEIREAEQQFRGKYAQQDNEIHHLHHGVSAIRTSFRQEVEQMVDAALGSWQREKEILQTQLSKALTAHETSEQSRKATADVNKILVKNAAELKDTCNSLSKQLEQEWLGHQKTVDKLSHMQTMLRQEDQTKLQMYHDDEDLTEWEHQLKEEAQRLSTQLHRIMGNHDTQMRAMRDANARLVTNLKMNIPQHSYHDSVNSARAKLQALLNSTRPNSAMPYLHYSSDAQQPHEGTFTRAHGLKTNIEESRTMGASPGRGQRPMPFSSYTESCPFPSYLQGRL